MNSPIVSLKRNLAILAVSAATCSTLHAASIAVPNGSFESPVAGPPVYVNPFLDSWQKVPKPAYFDEAAFGFQWVQTAGAFLDTVSPTPYGNRDGLQCGYMLSFPSVTLFQDYSVSPDFNATYAPGQSYSLTLGVFGKSLRPGNSLQISLYYRDAGNNTVTIGAPTSIAYDSTIFPAGGPFNFVDYSVAIPAVQAGDAWAGKNIGVMIQIGNSDLQGGYWDMDNLRLTTVPEPGIASLLAVGIFGVVARRGMRRNWRQAS